MRLFSWRQIEEARDFAEAGGQALHVYPSKLANKKSAPLCFKNTDQWAHLFDQDKERLVKTVRRLGVRKVVIHGMGRDQHVDLCAGPLRRAIESCEGEDGR